MDGAVSEPAAKTTLDDVFTTAGLSSPQERAAGLAFFQHLQRHHLNPLSEIQRLAEDPEWDRTPVSVVEFVEATDYLNLKGQVWPRLLEDLERFFHGGDYTEAVLRGALGWGKTTWAELAELYMVYQVSCLRNPQRTYGLIEGSTIAFANISVTVTQAKRVIWKRLRAKLRSSPYFRDVFPSNPYVTSELRFPKDVWVAPMGSLESHVIGLDIFGAVIDESNFLPVVEDSKHSHDGQPYDAAVTLYNALSRRQHTRFMELGNLPGKIIVVSASQYPDDFTERKAQEAEIDPRIFSLRYAVWETKPRGKFLPGSFRVEVGDNVHASRILPDGESPRLGNEVLDGVPEDFRSDFEKDADGATRDLGGRAKVSVSAFLRRRETIEIAIDPSREHPFPVEQLVGTSDFPLIVERLCARGENGGGWRPRWHPNAARTAHVDLAATGDGIGVAVGCSPWNKAVLRYDPDSGAMREETCPFLWYDLLLRIIPPGGASEMQIAEVRRGLLVPLQALGFRFVRITYDQWQSKESCQWWNAHGVPSEVLSVDKDTAAHDALKSALYDERVSMYRSEILRTELLGLRVDVKRRKVDHLPRSSKDLADAAAGVAHHWTFSAPQEPLPPSPGLVETAVRGLPISKEDFDWLRD